MASYKYDVSLYDCRYQQANNPFIHPFEHEKGRYRQHQRGNRLLNIQQAIAALMLPVSSYFMFKGMNEWIICLFVSAILQTYVVFIRDYEEKKKNKED
jgi:hypothetical protein